MGLLSIVPKQPRRLEIPVLIRRPLVKRKETPMKRNIPISLALIALLLPRLVAYHADSAPTFSDWSAPVNLGAIVNSAFNDFGPAISKNGLSLYFTSIRPGGFGEQDIWVSQRPGLGEPWGPPTNLGPNVNTPFNESVPAFSRDGHWMFFNSNQPGGFGAADIWASWRVHTHDDFAWQPPVNLGSGVNTASADLGASFFENEEGGIPLLFFGSDRAGGAGGADIYVSALAADGSFGPATLVPELNSPQADQRPAIRFDGLEIFLFSDRLGSLGGNDLWAFTRASVVDPWSPPVNLGPLVNTASSEAQAYLFSDRRTLFFASNRPGGFGGIDLYVTTRERVRGQ
jgi:WD40-like Beta Propeller Repeat